MPAHRIDAGICVIRLYYLLLLWNEYLDFLAIKMPLHRQLATEGALVGSILAKDFFTDVTIMSDDVGQFNIVQHILCWIHA